MSALPGLHANSTSLKNKLSVSVTPNGQAFTTIPPALELGEVPIVPTPKKVAGAIKIAKRSTLFSC